MAIKLPDPLDVAKQQAEAIKADPDRFLKIPLERSLGDCPNVDRESALVGLEAFHKERMECIPPEDKYPEAKPWVDQAIAVDKHLKELAGLSDLQIAILRSWNEYLQWRGIVGAKAVSHEKCRVAYVPETDMGRFHIKNVDDPITHWKRQTQKITEMPMADSLNLDGTGSGLHLDDEPTQIFPLPVREQMLFALCNDVPTAREFLDRYCPFFGRQNIVLHDSKGNAIAIEKCSFNFIEFFEPGRNGEVHISGMVCRDPNSPQGKYQAEKRLQYVKQFGLPEDGSDMTFWARCHDAEVKLAKALDKDEIRCAELVDLFIRPYSEGGFNKDCVITHPDQPVAEYTLMTRIHFLDQKIYMQYQRDDDGKHFDETPERYDFS